MAMTAKEKASYEKHKRVIQRIKELHIKSTTPIADSMCQECCNKWPCRTLQVLDSRS